MNALASRKSGMRVFRHGDVMVHGKDENGFLASLQFAGSVNFSLFFTGKGKVCWHCHMCYLLCGLGDESPFEELIKVFYLHSTETIFGFTPVVVFWSYLRDHSLSSLPTSDSVKYAPMYLKWGVILRP